MIDALRYVNEVLTLFFHVSLKKSDAAVTANLVVVLALIKLSWTSLDKKTHCCVLKAIQVTVIEQAEGS